MLDPLSERAKARRGSISPLISKTSKVVTALANGRDLEALRIAKGFRNLGPHKITIQRGWEAHTNPRLTRQLGRDPDAAFKAAIDALHQLYPRKTCQ